MFGKRILNNSKIFWNIFGGQNRDNLFVKNVFSLTSFFFSFFTFSLLNIHNCIHFRAFNFVTAVWGRTAYGFDCPHTFNRIVYSILYIGCLLKVVWPGAYRKASNGILYLEEEEEENYEEKCIAFSFMQLWTVNVKICHKVAVFHLEWCWHIKETCTMKARKES